jgi:hypothetical protein
MKKINIMKNISYLLIAILVGFISSCGDDFLTKEPLGVVGEAQLATEKGVDALLIAAYGQIDGLGSANNGTWASAPSNWIYGSVASDDAYKGTDNLDQPPATQIERFIHTPTTSYFNQKWISLYDGVSRCNDVIRVAQQALDDGEISDAKFTQVVAEARFLRGHFMFNAKIIFGNPVWVDETVTDYFTVGNVSEGGEIIDVWPFIEADFQAALNDLPEERSQVGRADKMAARAYLAKTHMQQADYSAAKPLLDAVLADAGPGQRFELMECYHDNYTIAGNNNKESIWEYQASVNEPGYQNGNYGDVLNFPYTGGPGTCCGFHQPSQNLVNAFQTDGSGLPLLDTFNDTEVKSDQGITSAEPFEEHTGPLDPRLDWTVGRRGIPYLDWGDHPGSDWIRDQAYGGPYAPIKEVYYAAEEGTGTSTAGWTSGATANNVRFIRLGHVILWRAEVAVEENDLATALDLVNQLRTRARDGCYVQEGGVRDDGSHADNAANYQVEPYPSFPDQEYARKAVRFETRLEFGMEGSRFFDLVRWGVAADVLNEYVAKEGNLRAYLQGVTFVAGKNEVYPIPQTQIDVLGSDLLKQNPGY